MFIRPMTGQLPARMSALQLAGCHSSCSSWRDLCPAWLLTPWLRLLMKISSGEAVEWVRCGCMFIAASGDGKPWRCVDVTSWTAAAAGSWTQSEPSAMVSSGTHAYWAQKTFQRWLRYYIKLFRWEPFLAKLTGVVSALPSFADVAMRWHSWWLAGRSVEEMLGFILQSTVSYIDYNNRT